MGTVLVVACPCSRGRGETHSLGSASETNPLKSYVCDPLWSTMLLCSHTEGKEGRGPTIFFLCLCSRHGMEREKLQFGLVTSREWHGERIAHHFPYNFGEFRDPISLRPRASAFEVRRCSAGGGGDGCKDSVPLLLLLRGKAWWGHEKG